MTERIRITVAKVELYDNFQNSENQYCGSPKWLTPWTVVLW